MATIQISASDFEQIKLVVGSILTDANDGKPLLYTDDQIKTVCLIPALETYFSYFPLKSDLEQTITADTTTTVAYPDQFTYGTTHISVVNRAGGATGGDFSFWQTYAFSQMYGNKGRGLMSGYGTGRSINGSRHLRHILKAEMDSSSNEGTYRYKVNHPERQVEVYSSFTGDLFITWAKYSHNFDDIMFSRKQEVINLARGFLLQNVGNILSIIPDTGAAIDIDAGNLKEQGQLYIESVMEKWQSAPVISILRN